MGLPGHMPCRPQRVCTPAWQGSQTMLTLLVALVWQSLTVSQRLIWWLGCVSTFDSLSRCSWSSSGKLAFSQFMRKCMCQSASFTRAGSSCFKWLFNQVQLWFGILMSHLDFFESTYHIDSIADLHRIDRTEGVTWVIFGQLINTQIRPLPRLTWKVSIEDYEKEKAYYFWDEVSYLD